MDPLPPQNETKGVYNYLFRELADPRTTDWFLIGDPFTLFGIVGLYLYFVLKWGPNYMKDRKPFEFKYILIIYNFLQVLISLWLFVEGMEGAWLTRYSWKCEPVDFSRTPHALRVARGVYIYFLAKISELLDTVFFVLRKKDQQITFLHMYHHSVMPLISWGATKYYPGGHGTFVGVINSFVHIIMYFYYMVAAFGPEYQRYLWWKKYITTLQMVRTKNRGKNRPDGILYLFSGLFLDFLQFGIAFLHNSQLLFYDCGYPRWSVVFTLPNAIFFYYLFSDFYKKAYTPEDGEKKSDSDTESETKNTSENSVKKIVMNGQLLNENRKKTI